MAEVNSHTSQKSVLSSVNQKAAPSAFDLRSWQGLTSVLQAARESLGTQEYAAFRDMVLSYAQSGGDPEIKARIDQVIATFKKGDGKATSSQPPVKSIEEKKESPSVTPPQASKVTTEMPSQPATADRMRVGRPTPVFGVSPETGEPQKSDSLPSRDSAHDVAQAVQTPVPPQTVQPSQEDGIKQATNEPSAQERTAPQGETREEAKPPVPMSPPAVPDEPNNTVRPAVTYEKTPTEEKKATDLTSVEGHKTRIAEIKRIVHNEIGNPVMLIDAGNRVGRDYMNALLVAMKASGGGSPIGIDDAMQKLEQTFEELMAVHRAKAAQGTAEDTHVADVEELPVTEAQSAIQETEEAKQGTATPTPEVLTQTPQPLEPEPKLPEVVEEHTHSLPLKEPVHTGAESGEVKDIPALKNALKEAFQKVHGGEQLEETAKDTVSDTEPTVDNRHAVRVLETEVPEIETPTAPVSVPDTAVITASPGIIDTEPELNTQEVTSALSQLLHEWSIFASSGVFGMGPGGFDHPLYQKLASLPMLTVAHGAWDGAKQDERESMRDYVNAWRHEQSISYNPTETFEHYLRRVVVRVLKRQKGLPSA